MAHYVGLMSGTSLDGVDAVLVSFDANNCWLVRSHFVPYSEGMKQALLSLHTPQPNELELSQVASLQLAQLYAEAVRELLQGSLEDILAIGCHGQTIRHRPELGFSLQLNNPALLAELTGITVIADFRNRDIAAGGQGAPLVPAFHQAVFADPDIHRNIVNIGGISNLTDLPIISDVTGFDCGPGNLLMDTWCQRHTGQPYDKNGDWAAQGRLIQTLLDQCLQDRFFQEQPPKSTGRELFNPDWLAQHLKNTTYRPEDVQYTLTELTARGITDAIQRYYPCTQEVYLCGGGSHNGLLRSLIQQLLPATKLDTTDTLGVPADWVEAAAFAWLAKQAMEGRSGNLTAVTGARAPRILGAIYPA